MQRKLSLRKISIAVCIFITIIIGITAILHKFQSNIYIEDCEIIGHSTSVRSNVHGILHKLLVDNNSDIQADAPLVEIQVIASDEEKDMVEKQYQEAQKHYQALLSQNQRPVQLVTVDTSKLAAAQAELTKYEKLYSIGAVSKRDLDNAKQNYNFAKAASSTLHEQMSTPPINPEALKYATKQLAQSKELYDKIQQNRNIIVITAPVAGNISFSSMNIGTELQPGEELAQIDNNRDLYVRVPLTPAQYDRVHLGQLVQYKIGQEEISGVIQEFIQRTTGYYAKVSIPEDKQVQLKAHTKVNIHIVI